MSKQLICFSDSTFASNTTGVIFALISITQNYQKTWRTGRVLYMLDASVDVFGTVTYVSTGETFDRTFNFPSNSKTKSITSSSDALLNGQDSNSVTVYFPSLQPPPPPAPPKPPVPTVITIKITAVTSKERCSPRI